jgi:peptide-methionine (S)-S-oxide reductase
VRRLLAEGANPRVGDGRETPLHAAARRGPLALVETLIGGGALVWQTDAEGHTALEVARRGRARDRDAIVALLDRGAIADPSFRAAVDAIHTGDVGMLERLLDAEPRLLRERILEPEVYRAASRSDYFLDPKLFWFIANNPTLVDTMAPNIVEVARAMLARGVDNEDLDYALALTMSSRAAREQGHQVPLVELLIEAGARPSRDAIAAAACYRELDVLRALPAIGFPIDAPIAAALGENARLRELIATAGAADVAAAFSFAVINGNLEGARIALDAGADVNAPLTVHSHSTALHQAAVDDNVALIELLLARGARLDARDTLWDGTPLGWAIHENRPAARAALERAAAR